MTQLSLPRVFLEQIGFTQAVREAARLPADPELMRIFQKIAPNVDWVRARENSGSYEPPRWMGYWSSHGQLWVTDGVLRLVVRQRAVLEALFEQVRGLHFRKSDSLPFATARAEEPSHLLLHDTSLWRLYVCSFEQGEATLVRQARTPV